uniref:Pentatricopeptide repeat-containing protein n=1 Tax=Solanum tuberosum TaxID=4113 RepID=M0ZR40_SOLTU
MLKSLVLLCPKRKIIEIGADHLSGFCKRYLSYNPMMVVESSPQHFIDEGSVAYMTFLLILSNIQKHLGSTTLSPS